MEADGHFLSFATILLGLTVVIVLGLGGTILFFTFRQWDLEKEKEIQKEQEKNSAQKAN